MMNEEYGQWRLSIIRKVQAQKLKPKDVASLLQERFGDFPDQRWILEPEVKELAGTEHWRDVSLPEVLTQ